MTKSSPPGNGSPHVAGEHGPELGVSKVQCRPGCPAKEGVEQRVEISLGSTDRGEEEGVVVELQ